MEENKLPHVLCIQESTNPNLKWFKSSLAYPYTCRYPGYNSNTAILSVFPIEQSGKVPFDKGMVIVYGQILILMEQSSAFIALIFIPTPSASKQIHW
jgi:hypothetical protein